MRKKKLKIKKKKHTKQSTAVKEPFVLSSEVKGLLLLSLAVILFASMVSFAAAPKAQNILGVVGATLGRSVHAALGLGGYLLCAFIGWIGWRMLFSKSLNHLGRKVAYIATLLLSIGVLLSLLEHRFPYAGWLVGKRFYTGLWDRGFRFHLGGAPAYYLYHDLPGFNLHHVLNTFGVFLIFGSLFFASLMLLAKISPYQILGMLQRGYSKAITLFPERKKVVEDVQRFVKLRTQESQEPSRMAINPDKELKDRPSISRKALSDMMPSFPFDFPAEKEKKSAPAPVVEDVESKSGPYARQEAAKRAVDLSVAKREKALKQQSVYNGDFKHYKLPNLSHLTMARKVDQASLKKDLRRQAEVLEETLLSFGIEAKVGQINCGPSITSFEVHPAIGVKVQKIKTLENDIALNMEAKSIRIIAPIPGKAAVGIEVPNPQPQEVSFKEMVEAYRRSGRKFKIPVLLGQAVNGEWVMTDLTKMPHMIIAGATGSGKSVCINTVVMSILLSAKPDEIKLVMVDPKKVELTAYSTLPHMLAPVITEPHGACSAMQWLVTEMERRYNLLKLVGVRNIDSFNNRTIDKNQEEELGEVPEKLHYIVGIVDELADLMMVASSDIETPIARIAQMARAVGIHLILATQRPSREVITGLIKANFPTRVSFKVSSRVNSQIILDEIGAESLLGNGDMLFLPPGSSHLIRAQGAFIRDEDINAIVKEICDQAPPNYMIESFDVIGGGGGDTLFDGVGNYNDSLYPEAFDVVASTGNASTTFLQRKLKIGYARAASLMDELESNGVVGPSEGAKGRKVLVSRTADNDDECDLFAESFDERD
ncbi:MAG: DNA translocase FtsK [Chlamydiales bacterium]|nr:DNA translocase FtsK [Chlamydiia bacterium]MCP5507596.1 DNA translocase FtsK [Chlamydiales bacterium]